MAHTPAVGASDLVGKLFAVIERMKRDFNEAAAAHGLTALQARTLLALEEPQPMRMLAEGMVCDASNVTGLADRLERLGLVERVPDPADRRVKLLSLTERGQALRDDLTRHVGDDATVTARLTRTERIQLDALLDKLLTG